MPKRILPLTDIQLQKAKPSDKDYKLSGGGGLRLWVNYGDFNIALPANRRRLLLVLIHLRCGNTLEPGGYSYG